MLFLLYLFSLAFSAKKTTRKSKKKQTITDNVLYVTEQNMSYAFEDLPAVLLLVQLGSDTDGRFRTRADFIAAASNLGSRCYFAIMDGDRNMKFVKSSAQKDSKGYYFYRYGNLIGRYSGGSSTEEISNFAMSKTGIAFTTFDDYTIAQDFIESNDGCVVLYLEKTGGRLFEKYGEWAEHLRDNTTFGLCPDPDIADELEVETFPTLILYRQMDHLKAVYPDDLNQATMQDITEWINYNKKPKFEKFQVDKQSEYFGKKPILLFFTPVKEDNYQQSIGVITNLASTWGHDLQVLTIDAVTGNRFMTGIGFGRYADPAACILVYSPKGKLTKYLHDEEDPFTEDHIGNFIENFLNKNLQPHIRYSQLPKDSNSSVVEVNALTFNETVMNPENDTLVLYFEEWDRLYQDFLPEYEALSDKFNKVEHLNFVKFNIATNDLLVGPDPKITPSVYLFTKNSKKVPILYGQKLKGKELEAFIIENLGIATEL